MHVYAPTASSTPPTPPLRHSAAPSAPMPPISPARLNAQTFLLRELNTHQISRQGGTKFIPEDALHAIFDSAELRGLLDQISHELDASDGDWLAKLRSDAALLRKYRKIIAILVLIGWEGRILRFVRKGCADEVLPVTERRLLESVDPEIPWKAFADLQYQFLVKKLRKQRGRTEAYQENCVLPFVSKEYKGKGGFATVYRIEIHPFYDELEWDFDGQKEHVYALKQIVIEPGEDAASTKWKRSNWEQEVLANTIIQYKSHPNILPLLHHFKQGSEYNLIFPYAPATLEHVLANEPPPQTQVERLRFLEQITRLASALQIIHICDMAPDTAKGDIGKIGYHRDLKPDNILRKGRRYYISDFGLTKFTDRGSRAESGVLSEDIGKTMYRAPECLHRKSKSGRGGDIWSLATIYSEILSWCIGGQEGLEQYKEKRKHEMAFYGEVDWLDDGKKLIPEVGEWFEELKRRTEQDPLVAEILELLLKMLRQNPKARPDASRVDCELYLILEREAVRLGVLMEIEAPEKLPFMMGSIGAQRTQAGQNQRQSQPVWRWNVPEIMSYISDHQGSSGDSTKDPEELPDAPVQQATIQQTNRSNSSTSIESDATLVGSMVSSTGTLTNRPDPEPTKAPPKPHPRRSRGGSRRELSPFVHLYGLDTMFLIDDFDAGDPVWSHIRKTLLVLSTIACKYDRDGIDLAFINSDTVFNCLDSADEVMASFDSIAPCTVPDDCVFLHKRLDNILAEYLGRYKEDRISTKPLNLIIITSGEFADSDKFEETILSYARDLDRMTAPRSQLGVQFVLVKCEVDVQERFRKLDEELYEEYGEHGVRDMVDATPFDPDAEEQLSTQHKIMCGGMIKTFDRRQIWL